MMLPEWENPQQKQRAPQNASPKKVGQMNRKPRAENSKDQSFHDNNQSNSQERGFLPEIGNVRQNDNSKPRGNSHPEKKTLHRHNPTPLDRKSGTEDRKNPPHNNRERNHSLEPPEARKYFEENSFNNGGDFREDNQNTSNENNRTLRVPMRIAGQQPMTKDISEIYPSDLRATKRAYGQYLLDQMKANEDKKTFEKRKKWEEDRELLGQRNFFDGFGESRDSFLQKYKKKVYQGRKPTELTNFDKIHNHGRNYNIYKQSSLLNNDHSFSHQINLPTISVKGQRNEKENYLLNQTTQPYHVNDIFDPQESSMEEPPAPVLDYSGIRDNKQIERFETFEIEKRYEPGLKPSDSQKIRLRRKTSDKPIAKLDWKPSTDRLVNDSETIKNYINKLEYKKELDQQIFEKQLQRANDVKLRQMEHRIEELKMSKEKLKKELDEKATAINPTLMRRNVQQAHLNSVNSPMGTNHDENYSLQRQHFSNLKSHGNSLGEGGGSGAGGIIVLQPGDGNLKGNKSMVYNYSSRKNLEHKMRRELQESLSKSDMEISGPPNQLENQVHTEFNRLREELRENNQRFQEQLTDVKNYLKKPANFPRLQSKEFLLNRESDSRKSLINESKFVPIIDPSLGHVVKAELVVPINYLITKESELPVHMDPFPRIIHNDFAVRFPVVQVSNEGANNLIDKEALYDHLYMASYFEKSLKTQNIELRKEIQDMKVKLFKLLAGDGNLNDYNHIHLRLKQIKEDQNKAQNLTLPTREENIQSNAKSKYYSTPGRKVSESKTMESITFLSKSIMEQNEPETSKPRRMEKKMINSSQNNESKSAEPRFIEIFEPYEIISEVSSKQATNTTKNLFYQKEKPLKSATQVKQQVAQPQPKQSNLKKASRGIKRFLRIGEEDISKRL